MHQLCHDCKNYMQREPHACEASCPDTAADCVQHLVLFTGRFGALRNWEKCKKCCVPHGSRITDVTMEPPECRQQPARKDLTFIFTPPYRTVRYNLHCTIHNRTIRYCTFHYNTPTVSMKKYTKHQDVAIEFDILQHIQEQNSKYHGDEHYYQHKSRRNRGSNCLGGITG